MKTNTLSRRLRGSSARPTAKAATTRTKRRRLPATTANGARHRSPRQGLDATPPFDPNLPEDGALIIAEVLRDQFNALEAEIVQRVTQAAFDATVAVLNDAIAQRPDYSWVTAEVNNAMAAAVTTAAGQSSNITNNVGTFDEAAYPYYDESLMDRLIEKVNELISTLRRP